MLNLDCAIILILASRKFLICLRDTPLENGLPIDKAFPRAHTIVVRLILLGTAIHVTFHVI